MSEQHEEQPEPSRKEVLVIYGKRTRSLWFNKDDNPEVELANFEREAKATFEDVLEQNADLVVQLKDEKWKGEFVDLSLSAFIPNESVVRVVS